MTPVASGPHPFISRENTGRRKRLSVPCSRPREARLVPGPPRTERSRPEKPKWDDNAHGDQVGGGHPLGAVNIGAELGQQVRAGHVHHGDVEKVQGRPGDNSTEDQPSLEHRGFGERDFAGTLT